MYQNCITSQSKLDNFTCEKSHTEANYIYFTRKLSDRDIPNFHFKLLSTEQTME